MLSAISDLSMMDWLRGQVRILEAWREELACRPELDIEQIVRVERHYTWLTEEFARLENASR